MGKLYIGKGNVKALTRCRCYLSATLPDWSLTTLSTLAALLTGSLTQSLTVSLQRLSLSDITRDLCFLASPLAGGRTYIQDRGLSWGKGRLHVYIFLTFA